MIGSKICDVEMGTVGILYNNFQNIPKLILFNPLPLYYMGKLSNSTQHMCSPQTLALSQTHRYYISASAKAATVEVSRFYSTGSDCKDTMHLEWVAAENGLWS